MNSPTEPYYHPQDLKDFPNISEHASHLGKKFFDYLGSSMKAGALSEREKALIALSVSTVQKCPYCIDAYTNKCLTIGLSGEEMMEAIHVGAAINAGITLAHATQMRKILKKKEL
jgi:alkylhydroperoxidase/carboxymuconolactone decarboxylase family protein